VNCQHPPEAITQNHEVWTDHHPYGEDDYKRWHLVCELCEKKVELYSQYRDYHNGIRTADYYALTGRKLDLKEAKRLFKKNNWLFHEIKDFDETIKGLVMANPSLERKIEAKRKLIEKHKKELNKLITTYNGGKEPWL